MTLYLTRDESEPDAYIDHPTIAHAMDEAWGPARDCDECGQPVLWAQRTVLVHASTLDHQTVYVTVLHRGECLSTVADRMA